MKQKTTMLNIMDNNKIINGSSAQIIELNPELRNIGYADGININGALNDNEKLEMIDKAAVKFGEFLDALGCDWKNDPNSMETPKRVAKAYVNDLWAGRYNAFLKLQLFLITNMTVSSLRVIFLLYPCVHTPSNHYGKAHIAYIPQINQEIIGLSKLNRIVEHYARRGAIQENLTVRIHDAINKIVENNKGVAVMIEASHNCVQCRGVGHQGTSMKTSKLTGEFIKSNKTRNEFYEFVKS